MIRRTLVALFAVGCMLTQIGAAETKVTLTDVHMCCGSCVRRVPTSIKDVTGAVAVGSQADKTIVITAPDQATAQKAVNALLVAGFYGKSSDASIKVEAPSGAPDGKVQTLTVSGVHLCCASCVTAVKDVLGKLEGVTGNTVAANAPAFNVTGNFDAKTLFERLNAAGLAGKVGTAPATQPK